MGICGILVPRREMQKTFLQTLVCHKCIVATAVCVPSGLQALEAKASLQLWETPWKRRCDGLQEMSCGNLALGSGEPQKLVTALGYAVIEYLQSWVGREINTFGLYVFKWFWEWFPTWNCPQSHLQMLLLILIHTFSMNCRDVSGADVICTSRLSQSSLANCLNTFAVDQKPVLRTNREQRLFCLCTAPMPYMQSKCMHSTSPSQ